MAAFPPAGRARTRRADRADIAENILEEAAFAAERRRLVAFGADLADQLEPGAIDRGDIARFIEPDAQHLLIDRARPREGELARFARDIIIFVRAELADKSRTAERLSDRLALRTEKAGGGEEEG